MASTKKVLIYGGSGALGDSIVKYFSNNSNKIKTKGFYFIKDINFRSLIPRVRARSKINERARPESCRKPSTNIML